MRKRIVIGLLVLAVVGVTAYVLSEPRVRTVEYHKAKLLAGGKSKLPKWLRGHVPSMILRWEDNRILRNRESQLEALVKLGYLERRTFVISNRTTYEVLRRFSLLSRGATTALIFEIRPLDSGPSTNRLMLFGVREEMDRWVKIFREADAPVEKSTDLEERTFVLSNRFPYQTRPFPHALEPYFTNVEYRLVALIDSGTNTLSFRGPRDAMEEVEKAVREFDVPDESGN